MGDDYHRRPLSPREFRTAVERLMAIHPGGEITSGWRSVSHNAEVGGSPESKHLIGPFGLAAVDLDWPDALFIAPGGKRAVQLEHDAKVLGLWAKYHRGHLHLQRYPPGDIVVHV